MRISAGGPRETGEFLAPRPVTVSGAYLHVPFCFHKCHYCDFYSLVDTKDRQESFTNRLMGELRDFASFSSNAPLSTIFIGGGTPTLLRTDLWRLLLPVIRECLPLVADGEFTVEANPETVTDELASVLAEGGVNRVSIGAQSFDRAHLKTLERWHDPASVGRAIGHFRRAGIVNLNLDLIFAIPGQTLGDWEADLERALDLEPNHLSCYGLTYESNTPMTAKLRMGRFAPADEEVEAAMYERAMELLAGKGFEHYEISNWALPGSTCRHNLGYWRGVDWWAFGPSASGHVQGVRWRNLPRIGDYLTSNQTPIEEVERLSPDVRAGERLMLGLRMRAGLDEGELARILNDDESGRAGAIDRMAGEGLLESEGGRLRLTKRGLMIADSVLSELV